MEAPSTTCPCGTKQRYDECCGVYHRGDEKPKTAELTMRARYCAYAVCDIDFLVKTIPLLERRAFDRRSAKEWSKNSEWLGLEIVDVKDGQEEDTKGIVEFIATFSQDGVEHKHHERSTFKKQGDRWLFIDGKIVGSGPSEDAEISRNAPCPCGSGKKYKKCCGA